MDKSPVEEIERGHIYDLPLHNSKGKQRITFVKSLPEGDESNHDGSLNQDFIRALIMRLWDLQRQVPSKHTHKSIKRLRKVLIDHEVRAFERTLKKCYAKCGLHIEQLPVQSNGHFFDL